MVPFVVLGTPRSRTAWLAAFLSYGNRRCLHEPSRFWGGTKDIRAALARPSAAISDSMLTLHWRLISLHRTARILAVRRPVDDVMASFARAGLDAPKLAAAVARIAHEINDMNAAGVGLHITADSLDKPGIMDMVFRYCHGFDAPTEHINHWHGRVVVADAAAHIADGVRNRRATASLYPELAAL